MNASFVSSVLEMSQSNLSEEISSAKDRIKPEDLVSISEELKPFEKKVKVNLGNTNPIAIKKYTVLFF
jgi:hypothetical protein